MKKKTKSFYVGLLLVAFMLLLAALSVFWTPYETDEVNTELRMLSPSIKHIFGTDNMGRDIFSRVMVGLGTTTVVSLGILAIGAGVGVLVGAFTGYFGGPLDEALMRINDALASFPSILLALVCVSLFGAETLNVVIVLGVLFIPSFARVVRSEFIREKEKDYVKSARLYGASHLRIMFRYILPNTKESCFAALAIGINNAILAEAGLSYLGLGVQPPTPSLGRMIAEGQSFIMKAPWISVFPGMIILLTVLGFSLIAEFFENDTVTVGQVGRKKLVAFFDKKATDKECDLPDFENPNAEESYKNATVSEKDCDEYLLKVKDLHIAVNDGGDLKEIVKGLSFSLEKGESLGIVGESGSGKSMTVSAVMGLLGNRGVFRADSLNFDGKDISEFSQEEFNRIRGNEITMVFQEPMTSLDPSRKIGRQLCQVLKNHGETFRENDDTVRSIILNTMKKAGLEEVERVYSSYPHELSGGQRQRVLIAMAIMLQPKLLICDEPTTALDAEVADKILEQLKELQKEYGMSMLFISHDISVVGRMCDRIIVLKDGEKVEEGEYETVMTAPRHEYTKELVTAGKWSEGYREDEEGRNPLSPETINNTDEVTKDNSEQKVVCTVNNLSVNYRKSRKEIVSVLNGFSLKVNKGECVGISGKSGSGKTTLIKAIAGMVDYTGEINTSGNVTMVFQDPYSSLNPSMKVEKLLDEVQMLYYKKKKGAFEASVIPDKKERRNHSVKMLEQVGLSEEFLERRPSELSGGQRQRVAIAMAVINRPELVLLDEPVTALDVSIQKKVVSLLMELKKEYELTYILISHDARLLENVCDRVVGVE